MNYSYANIGKSVTSHHLLSYNQTAANIMKILSKVMYNRIFFTAGNMNMKYVIICNMKCSNRITTWKNALVTHIFVFTMRKENSLLCQNSDRAESLMQECSLDHSSTSGGHSLGKYETVHT